MNNTIDTPKTGITLPGYFIMLFVSLLILYFGKMLFIPILLGLLIAIIMYPVCAWFEKKKFFRALAITICLSITIIIFGGLIWLLVFEINSFSKDIPELKSRISASFPKWQQWINDKFLIKVEMQSNWLNNLASGAKGFLGASVITSINSLASVAFILFTAPIYTALFLYHRGTFVKFLKSIVPKEAHEQLNNVLLLTIKTYFNYIKGQVIVYFIVGILNSMCLLAMGIRSAILFGMLTALMMIIPYVGIIVSSLLPITVAYLTKDSMWYPLGIVIFFILIQLIEGNILFPKIVGDQLNVSTLATLVAIIAGGILWGVAGMVLFIPLVAIIKIISDGVESLKPINILLNRDEGYKKNKDK